MGVPSIHVAATTWAETALHAVSWPATASFLLAFAERYVHLYWHECIATHSRVQHLTVVLGTASGHSRLPITPMHAMVYTSHGYTVVQDALLHYRTQDTITSHALLLL